MFETISSWVAWPVAILHFLGNCYGACYSPFFLSTHFETCWCCLAEMGMAPLVKRRQLGTTSGSQFWSTKEKQKKNLHLLASISMRSQVFRVYAGLPRNVDQSHSRAGQKAGQTRNTPLLLLCMLVCCSIYHCLSVSTCVCAADLQQHKHCAIEDELSHPHVGTDRQRETGNQRRMHHKIIDVTHWKHGPICVSTERHYKEEEDGNIKEAPAASTLHSAWCIQAQTDILPNS